MIPDALIASSPTSTREKWEKLLKKIMGIEEGEEEERKWLGKGEGGKGIDRRMHRRTNGRTD